MLAALIIVFREVLEAGLIVGIVAAVTRGVAHYRLWIGGGVGAGVLGSLLVAAFLGTIASAFGGSGNLLFNAAILATAVVMLAWHNVWMAKHGRAMAAELRTAGEAVVTGSRSMLALAVVIAVAVLREGAEVVLFLFGIAVSGKDTAAMLMIGGFAGLLLGALVSGLTYWGMLNIPTRYLFRATSLLIAFLAAGMAAQTIAMLEQAGIVTALGETVWNTSALLSDRGIAGRILHTLIGYSDQPSLMQLLAYLATLAAIWLLMRTVAPGRPRAA